MKNQSFFSRFSDAFIFGGICLLVAIVFSLGFYRGLSQSDRNAVEMISRNKEMRDSIDSYLKLEINWKQQMEQVSPHPAGAASSTSQAY